MGHIAALPVLIAPGDVLFMDHQVHHSVQTAATLVRAQGTRVELLPHNDMRLLARRVEEAAKTAGKVWYAADGLYSMYADYLPVAELEELVARFDNLWLYVDDAHGFSWTGRHGRGYALEQFGAATLERTVVAGSLNKSFAASGGVITFPQAHLQERVLGIGGPMIFSGPVQPPMLGAILASAALHRTSEIAERQDYLLSLIRQFNTEATDAALPLVSPSEAPIRFIGAGTPEVAYNLTGRLREHGFFTDVATFPAVAAKRSGSRITLTAHHRPADITAIVEALAEALPAALAQEGIAPETVERVFAKQLAGRPVRLRGDAAGTGVVASLPRPRVGGLRLERFDRISEIDQAEWDGALGGRGSFDWAGLHTLEDVFAQSHPESAETPEHRWGFAYWLVREEGTGRLVAATFTTAALWKDDMLAAADVSAHVEALRAERDDPYWLTSPMLGAGSLMTEGDHLYLDRQADWAGALRLLLAATRIEEEATGSSAVVLRDLPDGDEERHRLLLGEGFVRMPVPETWVRELDFADDEEFLAGLGRKARYHQRNRVLSWEDQFTVRVHGGGAGVRPELSGADLDHLYGLYRNTHARNLELNVFPLPRRVLDAVLGSPAWELVTLSLDGLAAGRPVAFVVQHLGHDHVAPVFVGMDYDYVASHNSYQQLLWQAIRSGQRHGARRVLYGMSANLHKSRFGAVPVRNWAYVQATETYNADVLARVTQSI